jgi:hypothetical protein
MNAVFIRRTDGEEPRANSTPRKRIRAPLSITPPSESASATGARVPKDCSRHTQVGRESADLQRLGRQRIDEENNYFPDADLHRQFWASVTNTDLLAKNMMP